jgi:hypothetical protein
MLKLQIVGGKKYNVIFRNFFEEDALLRLLLRGFFEEGPCNDLICMQKILVMIHSRKIFISTKR